MAKTVKACVFLALLCTACATKTVYVPVAAQEPPVIVRPELETDSLKPGDEPVVVLNALRITIKKLQQYALELETALNAYRKK